MRLRLKSFFNIPEILTKLKHSYVILKTKAADMRLEDPRGSRKGNLKMSNKTFNYTYSASQQEEIKKIRDKYSASAKDPDDREVKMEQLRRLDKSVTKPGTIAALIVGIISVLVMGTGMSMCMVGSSDMFIPGIVIGVVGILGVIAAYPLYNAVTKRRRKKLAPEIIRLSDELMK